MASTSDPARELLRHSLATVAYRGGKALRGSPDHFGSFHIGDKTRTPAQILAHMGDLFDWALTIAQGRQAWHDSTPLSWNSDLPSSAKTTSRPTSPPAASARNNPPLAANLNDPHHRAM